MVENNLYLMEDAIARATGKPGPVEVLLGLVKTPSRQLAAALFPGQEIDDDKEGQALIIRGYAKLALNAYLHGFEQKLFQHY